ncbi:N-acetylmuramoyl-L-alanine amidase family protein [Rhodothermus profundi]|uniref:N-acetylmuramoyl-L-alanine amidase n=1 Tax=Rhodothermus profundi TaxID=633813 RepID=A0A1M6VGK1_9BACT|nr:N-acetylmuramoyl-L-alanine amidase [Rhodothermus profundi]SHK80622.1 N-acetylmuramoyl-L-alanine amidase [Rhodothermus profundi]
MRAALLLLLIGCFWESAWAHALPRVTRVSFAPRADQSGYVIRIHTTAHVGAYQEPEWLDAHRLQFVLYYTEPAPDLQHDPPQGPVRAYTIEPRDGHLIFQFELDERVTVKAAAYRDRFSTDILVGLTVVQTDPTIAEGGRLPQPAQARTVALNKQPTASPRVADRWHLDTIVIDPGHGGKDPGAVANGVREKDVTLAVALKLGEYLERLLGVRVVYTRKDDRFVGLRERGRIANEAGGKLFISLHCNALPGNRRVHGAETYFLGLHKTEAARRVMERENSVVRLEEDPSQYDHFTEQELILMTLAQSAYLRKSEKLAMLVQEQFARRVGRVNRGVKQAGFYVLWSASMPAILVELGFLTNPKEAAFLKSKQGQAYMASAIFRAARTFKEHYEREPAFPAAR